MGPRFIARNLTGSRHPVKLNRRDSERPLTSEIVLRLSDLARRSWSPVSSATFSTGMVPLMKRSALGQSISRPEEENEKNPAVTGLNVHEPRFR